jgi:hypothetical protein
MTLSRAILLVCLVGACDLGFSPNSAVVQLYWPESGDCRNPVVGPDGQRVWFINNGSICRIQLGDTAAEEVCAGDFSAIAISPDGALLAGIRSDTLVLLDTAGAQRNVVAVPDSDATRILDVEFNRAGTMLYWLTQRNVHYYPVWRSALDGTGRELAREFAGSAETRLEHFDLDAHDSVYGDRFCGVGNYPQFNLAADGEWVEVAGLFSPDLLVGTTGNLKGQDAAPFSSSFLRDPYWFPSGDTIVYSANATARGYGLWLLTRVRR